MKFRGTIGYAAYSETSPGVFTENITEKTYRGNVSKDMKRLTDEDYNPSIRLSNVFSIIADPYILENTQNMRYLSWKGQLWKIHSVEIQHPRVIISIGGVYNGG